MSVKYSEEQLTQLENNVEAQSNNSSLYDFENNLALLRLYQVFPKKSNVTHIRIILAKALMNLPETDFMLCTYLLDQTTQNKPEVAALLKLSEHIENAEFEKFWSEDTAQTLSESLPGFKEALTTYIGDVIGWTFRSTSKAAVTSALHLDDSEFARFAEKRSWTVKGDQVVIPANDFNNPTTRVVKFRISHDNIAKTLANTVRNQ